MRLPLFRRKAWPPDLEVLPTNSIFPVNSFGRSPKIDEAFFLQVITERPGDQHPVHLGGSDPGILKQKFDARPDRRLWPTALGGCPSGSAGCPLLLERLVFPLCSINLVLEDGREDRFLPDLRNGRYPAITPCVDKFANDVEQTAAANPDNFCVFDGFNRNLAVLVYIESLYRSPSPARMPQEMFIPSKAGPAAVEAALRRPFRARTISPLVPISTSRVVPAL